MPGVDLRTNSGIFSLFLALAYQNSTRRALNFTEHHHFRSDINLSVKNSATIHLPAVDCQFQNWRKFRWNFLNPVSLEPKVLLRLYYFFFPFQFSNIFFLPGKRSIRLSSFSIWSQNNDKKLKSPIPIPN